MARSNSARVKASAEQLSLPLEPRPDSLPRVSRVRRQGVVLHETPLAPAPQVLGLNLLKGCMHRCAFCSVRGVPHYAGDSELQLYDDTLSRLPTELISRQQRPRAVFISPATDPFPPLNIVQEETANVVALLAGHGVESWLMTRGLIRPAAFETLVTHRIRVKITVSLTTCDRGVQRLLEPWTAPPRLRLKQIAALRAAGIPVQVALDPLIPGVTDTRENLTPVLAALAAIGIKSVSTSYLFLREGIAEKLFATLAPLGLESLVQAAFQNGPVLTVPGLSPARYLPRVRRQRGYASLMAMASEHGIQVSVLGLTNPDFTPARAPASPAALPRMQQLSLKL